MAGGQEGGVLSATHAGPGGPSALCLESWWEEGIKQDRGMGGRFFPVPHMSRPFLSWASISLSAEWDLPALGR